MTESAKANPARVQSSEGSQACGSATQGLSSSSPAPAPERWQRLIAACRYWEAKKLALDAVRPDFTNDQLRELNAAEGRLLAAIHAVAAPDDEGTGQ